MNNFDSRKKEYIDKLSQNPRLIQGFLNSKANSEKALQIIFDPKTEKELSFADSISNMFADIIEIIDNSYEQNYDLLNSKSINIYVDLINAFKNDDQNKVNEIKEKFGCLKDSNTISEFLYDFLSTFITNPVSAVEEIAQRCGFDVYDEESMIQFKFCLNEAQKIVNQNNLSQYNINNIDIESNELINMFIDIANEFHFIHEQEKNKRLIL